MAHIPTSLVLGAGGARGLAHIGVIRCLEAHGYEIRYISGASMGALVGGIYAAGKLDTFADWVTALQRLDVLLLLDWSLNGSLFKGERIIRVLRELVGDCRIEDLPIGFTAIATELSTGREMWLNRGPLFDAIRASIAVPTVFAAVTLENLVLVDGGLVNPVPVAPTLNVHTDVTIAVDLNAPDEPDAPVRIRAGRQDASPSAHRQRILSFIDTLLGTDASPTSTQLGFYDLAARSMDAMQRTITQLKLASYAPTLVIPIPGNLCGFFDFYRAQALIDYGYERTEQALATLGA
ncbi:MAG TPA: patatin-like phospholipase family protein [Gammaproteobacteria bacterium]